MPRYYKAQIEHTPLDFEREFHSISRYFRGKARDFVRIFDRWNLPHLMADDRGTLIHEVRLRLCRFVLDCDALPMRTPRKLMATVRAIARDPSAFVERHDAYDPQASASVFIRFASTSSENRMRFLLFEAGIEATKSMARLIEKTKGG